MGYVKKEIYSIQYARAVAAIFIVLYHVLRKGMLLGFNNYQFSVGTLGVPFFFIVSGYIISYIQKDKLGSIDFLAKRLKRVLPLYYFFTVFVLIIYLISPNLVSYSHNAKINIISSFFLTPAYGESILLNPGWTLKPELAFYLVFCLALTFFKSYLSVLRVVIFISFMISLASLFYNYAFFSEYGRYLYIFAVGVIIYLFTEFFYFRLRPCCLILSIVFVFITNYFFAVNEIINVIMISFLFLSVLKSEGWIQHQNFCLKYLRYLGDSSYSIYLSHVFVIGLMTYIFNRGLINGMVFNSLSIVLSLSVGILVYELVEKKIASYFRN